jgi:anti-sigma factor RsiW
MTNAVHLSEDLIARVVDNELTPGERLFAEGHLAICAGCRKKRMEWAEMVERVEDAVLEIEPMVPADARQRLANALDRRESVGAVTLVRQEAPGWWKWGAVAAVAASLAFLISLPPVRTQMSNLGRTTVHPAAAAGIEGTSQTAAGEPDRPFIPLPYSGVALAEGEEEIVRVQMPAEALANAGIIPPGSYADNSWVDADLLLGLDGQPQGIRLVNADQVMSY